MNNLEELKKKFEDAKLKCKILTQDGNLAIKQKDAPKVKRPQLVVDFPEERENKSIIILDDNELEKVRNSQIEKYKFIRGYEAIWSNELSCIECEIGAEENLLMTPSTILWRLKSFLGKSRAGEQPNEEVASFEFPSPSSDIKITIGLSSTEFAILQNFQRELFFPSGRIKPRLTFKIEGKALKTHEEAKEFLLKIANSILFQIDLATDIPFHLLMDRQIMKGIRSKTRRRSSHEFQAPKYEYDKEPLALYWYARTSRNMPLLQFLAFYQVMEFYFPYYSFSDAQNRIKNLLKSPLFDTNKDTDIAQIVNIIKSSSKGKSIGDEKSQIRATVQQIVSVDELLTFFNEDLERKGFFDQTTKEKGVSKQRLVF
jgi:hypothetical protein